MLWQRKNMVGEGEKNIKIPNKVLEFFKWNDINNIQYFYDKSILFDIILCIYSVFLFERSTVSYDLTVFYCAWLVAPLIEVWRVFVRVACSLNHLISENCCCTVNSFAFDKKKEKKKVAVGIWKVTRFRDNVGNAASSPLDGIKSRKGSRGGGD